MTPAEFIKKWSASTLKERSGAQEHFIDLCHLLDQKTPAEADPDGTTYTFEKGAGKHGGGDGWADVWLKGHFAWEYKGKHKNLEKAYNQLLRYRESLANPPALVVCDMNRFEIHTNFTGTLKKVYAFDLEGLLEEENLRVLRLLFESPEDLKPGIQIEEVTERAARDFASLAQHLRDRGHDPRVTAQFLDRLLFCLFAEDVGLLPHKLFQEILEAGVRDPAELNDMLSELFKAMAQGGRFGTSRIHFFNGNLFQGASPLPLTTNEIRLLTKIAALDWSQIEPAIFGTLFERGLDPAKRSQLGAHYTDRQSILRVVEPVLMDPLRRAWATTRTEVEGLLIKVAMAKTAASSTRYRKKARSLIEKYRSEILDPTVVLDPACGSGNFLFIALDLLHELEKEVLLVLAEIDRGQMSLDIRVGPHMVHGIEINPFAQELAHVTVWIGHFQWQLKNGFSFETNPVLKPLDNIELRDAILTADEDGKQSQASWPTADVVIGNPPFLGGKRMRTELGDEYVDALFTAYEGSVPREADLVTYWFERARAAISAGSLKRAGLLGTNSIRGGASRKVLDHIRESGQIFMAWSDEPWVVEGAAVRISLVGFDGGQESEYRLDGNNVGLIFSDLTGHYGTDPSSSVDLTKARRLKDNLGISFMGDTKGGPFDIPGDLAREWLALPLNPNGRPNSDVVHPWVNAMDITRRPRDMWIIDFGVDMPEEEAALYEAPFEYVRQHVKPLRDKNRRKAYRERWWLHVEPRPALRAALAELPRALVTPAVAKHRIFAWLPSDVTADHALFAFARTDDYFFGVLQSRFHEVWALRMCSWLGVGNDPRYTPTSTFETFPFPKPTDEQRNAIASAVRELNALRTSWLNPQGASANDLKKRTLTNLYNERPSWLANAHAALDSVVAEAYKWPRNISDESVLELLLKLNLDRTAA